MPTEKVAAALRAAMDRARAEQADLVTEFKACFPDAGIGEQWIEHKVAESPEIAEFDEDAAESLGLTDLFGEISAEDFDEEAFLEDDIECDDGDVELVS